MRLAGSALLALLLQDSVCVHPTCGETRPIDLRAVHRAYREAARRITFEVDRVSLENALAAPYESGLPACRGRAGRVASVAPIPVEFIGQTLHFGPTARDGTTHVVTSTRSLRGVIGGVLATPELAARFEVRCAPSTVRVVSATEVRIDEGD
ncbi:MAG: hypothetical protein HYY16_01150 [Planctomycetes bacterium]|nr:hypothetical protein [Planctomycetota bacterium]